MRENKRGRECAAFRIRLKIEGRSRGSAPSKEEDIAGEIYI